MKLIRTYSLFPFILAMISLVFVSSVFAKGLTHHAVQIDEPQRLQLTNGESKIIETGNPFKRVSVANPEVVDQIVLSPSQVYLSGKSVGVTHETKGAQVKYWDAVIFASGWLVGQWVFRGYEAHVRPGKRLLKLVLLAGVFFAIHQLAGRPWFYGLLILMATGMAILHGYWFHYRHGIHWRTAEPREKYLRLIGKLK